MLIFFKFQKLLKASIRKDLMANAARYLQVPADTKEGHRCAIPQKKKQLPPRTIFSIYFWNSSLLTERDVLRIWKKK